MNATRFDSIAKLFASRRLSRRQALARGGAGIAAGTLAAIRVASDAEAQDATPAAPAADGDQGPTMLFVQAFRAGGVTPAEGVDDRYTLTLEGGLGQTVFFSDRPERIVGAHPTPTFLAGLGFPEDNPPNAALVVETEAGQTEIAVVELFNPSYDEATHTATYEVAMLGEWERAADMSFIEADADLAEVLPAFGAAHLFIDDCPDALIWCEDQDGNNLGNATSYTGHCYSWGAATCLPCSPWYTEPAQARSYWDSQCNAILPCGAGCAANNVCTGGVACDPD
jgi:hypothetical protein